jgi:hypothetical protein
MTQNINYSLLNGGGIPVVKLYQEITHESMNYFGKPKYIPCEKQGNGMFTPEEAL